MAEPRDWFQQAMNRQIEWVRAQRETEVDDEACKVPGVAEGTCAYAGPDGEDGCGPVCAWKSRAAAPSGGEEREP